MTADSSGPQSPMKRGQVVVQPGQPLKFVEADVPTTTSAPANPIGKTIGATLKAYRKAAKELLEGKYIGQKELAPPNMRGPCDIFVLRCSDGILVRYDLVSHEEAKIRCGHMEATLAEVAPQFSEQVIHFPQNPLTYVPSTGGVEIALTTTDPKTGTIAVPLKMRPMVYATTKLPDGFQMPPPPARPICLAAVHNEIYIQLQGVLEPTNSPTGSFAQESENFIAHSCIKLPVGWQTIEIYPSLGDEYWKPEYAPLWAELDLLGAIAQSNAIMSNLGALDSRGAARKYYAILLEEFEALLQGPEEPAHQFLKKHPELLCPTAEQRWSKLSFGNRDSDFVFREPHEDYLLVEIEAPIRELFRHDGQQRQELTHAINQITDWIQYITDNKQKVEQELGLTGISTNPRILVVIGRSASLTEENRRKLVSLQALQNKLQILTYDDLIARARANLERILGPLDFKGQNVELYFYKEPPPPGRQTQHV
jgi:Domain of unknown function (DUF4263)